MFSGTFSGVGRTRSNARDEDFFCSSISDNIVLYGLFTDCTDKIASKYAAKHLPIEFLNLWKEQVEKPDIELMLKMVFEVIENRLLQLQVGRKIDGTSALVVVIHGHELFVAHTGCNRVLMYMKQDNVTYINQLVVEHNLKNSKESKRLSDMGIERSNLISENFMGYPFTRCLGNINLKKFYGNIPSLGTLTSSPWIATPDVVGPFKITDSNLMLVLACSGIINYFSNAGYLASEINKEIVSRINRQIPLQPTLDGVAQAVIDEIAFSPQPSKKGLPQKVDASTLIIHCFRNIFAISSSNDQFLARNSLEPLSIDVNQGGYSETQMRSYYISPCSSRHEAKSVCDSFSKSPSKSSTLPLDENGRIAPYVDFSFYYQAVDKLAADHMLDNHSDLKALLEFEKTSRDIINS